MAKQVDILEVMEISERKIQKHQNLLGMVPVAIYSLDLLLRNSRSTGNSDALSKAREVTEKETL